MPSVTWLRLVLLIVEIVWIKIVNWLHQKQFILSAKMIKKITEKRNNAQARSQGPSFSALRKETKTKDGLGTLPDPPWFLLFFLAVFMINNFFLVSIVT